MTWLFALALVVCPPPPDLTGFTIAPARDYQVSDLAVDITVTAVDSAGDPVPTFCGPATVSGLHKDGEPVTEIPVFAGGKATLGKVQLTGQPVVVALPGSAAGDGGQDGAQTGATMIQGTWTPDLRQLPGALSLLPPVMAIVLAILVRQALLALFAGVWLGALFVHGYNPLTALIRCFDTYLPGALAESSHAAIVLFTMALGGMVGVISKSGGTRALVDAIAARASSRRSGQVTAWVAGLVVFFDDYANCLLVGNTVRPFTDSMRISREKLAYIVDSTAAPVATVALISTWVGYQIGLFDDVFGKGTGYDLFLSMLPYSFYSFFTLAFVLAVAVTLRDFGPMARAERRALETGHLVRPDGQPLMDQELTAMEPERPEAAHWATAIVPVVAVIVIVFAGLYISGRQALGEAAASAGLRAIIASADSYAVLLWASFGGGIIAAVLSVALGTMRMSTAVESWVGGVKSMVMAVLILVLAWALGTMCKDYLMTGPWLVSQIQPSAHLMPVLTFVVASIIALTTGSSFSTMAIVIPIVGPMAWAITGADVGIDPATVESIRLATMAAVLSGAVFGDHCSPISDTTIMSSMSSASDHVDHVRTQAPYAILCALAAAIIGFVPAGYGVSPLVTIPLGIVVLVATLRLVGRRPDAS
jgi:Na+/H+ antiporter NhaC